MDEHSGESLTEPQRLNRDLAQRDREAGLSIDEASAANSDLANYDWRRTPAWKLWLAKTFPWIKNVFK